MDIDVATRELLKVALLPPGIVLLVLLVGWITAGSRFGRLVLVAGILSLYLLSTSSCVNWLASHVETVPALTQARLRTAGADAIWVLLAGITRHNPEHGGATWVGGMSLRRLDYALRLHRATGLPVVLSGGSPSGNTRSVASVAADWWRSQLGIEPFAVEAASRDTWENARRSAELFQRRNISRVLLVTHAFHMPRALLSARAAGIDAIPAPFGFAHSPLARSEPMSYRDWLPRPGNLGRSYLMLHELAGLLWYEYAR